MRVRSAAHLVFWAIQASVGCVALSRAAWAGPESEVAVRGSLRAMRALGKMEVDGRAQEDVWQRAATGVVLAQREPVYGGPAPLGTWFQVAYDDQALFVLVRAQVGPAGTVVRTLKRDDASLVDDDNLTVKIDPNHDRRTSFNFMINTVGAQHDSLILDDGGVSLGQWDAVWEARVTRDAQGYVAEYRIPFAILGVQARSVHTMGFNLSRVSVRPSATADWTLPDPPQNANGASTYGQLTDITGIRAKRALELWPYAALRTDFRSRFGVDPRRDATLRTGFDARIQTSPGSYAELSVLTDFSQEAIDSVQVAGDRFPLFYDEQRAFFLNGLSELRFGQYKTRQLVDTRRIGLVGASSVPVATGLKAYGQTDDWAYAFLNVQTLGSEAPVGEAGGKRLAAENFSVARVRFNSTRNLWLGGIVALRHRFVDPGNEHFSLGVDGELKSDDGKLAWYTFWAGAATEHPSVPAVVDATGREQAAEQASYVNRGESLYSRVRYSGRVFRPYLDYAYSTRDFDPALGYYSRTGVAEHYAIARTVPRIDRFGVQEIAIAPSGYFTTDTHYSRLLKNGVSVEASVLFEPGQTLLYRLDRRVEVVESGFPLLGFDVAAGRYATTAHVVTLTTPVRKSVDAFFKYAYSTPFSGYRHEVAQSIRVRASRHLTVNAGYEYWLGRLDGPEERFGFGFGNGSATLALNPDLVLDGIARFSLQPRQEQLGAQARLRYRYHPGSDLFLVYRTNQPLRSASGEPTHELSVKLNYHTAIGL